MAREIIVEPSHFRFLRLQKGSLDKFSDNFPLWLSNYRASIFIDLGLMKPFLPHNCSSVLDIGSGLGGIDVALNDWYGGNLSVTLLDGEKDRPLLKLHRETFNDMDVARDFLQKNGVKSFSYLTPEMVSRPVRKEGWDLIVSLGSWCFHYPPSYYLNFVARSSKPGTILILDVRSGKRDWQDELAEAFGFIGDVVVSKKWIRKAYRAK